MTKQASFKARIRARMDKTGERYTAARAALIAQSPEPSRREWVSEPEVSDSAVSEATGRGWNDWCDAIEDWPETPDHRAIARRLQDDEGLDGWWAQTVTVGYERITGLCLPYQAPDGTFTASKSATVPVEESELRAALLDDSERGDLFPGRDTTIVSRAGSKALRIGFETGTAVFSIDDRGDGRTKVAIAHEGLPEFEDVGEWKAFWSDWFEALVE